MQSSQNVKTTSETKIRIRQKNCSKNFFQNAKLEKRTPEYDIKTLHFIIELK